jgi:DNA-binding response OmpR family regulator
MRILVVDDDQHVALITSQSLRQVGYSVDVCTNGREALERITHQEYDLITLDWNMPHVEGPDVAQKLREQNIATPILMITGRTEPENKVKGLDKGADDYLTKPYDVTELQARVRALLRRPVQSQDLVLQVADLVLEPSQQRATRSDLEIELTQKEYSLLEYLVRHKNTTLSREQLLQHVWGVHSESASNRLDASVKNLRKKIDVAGLPRLIETVRGRGYKITDAS